MTTSRRRSFQTAVAAFALLVAACGTNERMEQIAAAELGDKWPFTVNEITLRCGDAERNHVIFEANGALYALNGSARGSAKMRDGVWMDSDKVRKVDPTKAAQPDIFDRPYTEMPPSLIERGLRLCALQAGR